MKTIIVPTDFSKNAFHAAAYAVQMAEHLGHKVLLMHAYETPVAISEYEINTIHFHTMEEHILKRLEDIKENLKKDFDITVPIETIAFNDDLVHHIAQLYESPDAFLTVIGLTGAGMVNFFLGSNTLSIVNNLGRTVLTIPPFTPYKAIKRIVFAFDLWNVEETLPVNRIKRVLGIVDAELLILNVRNIRQGENQQWEEEKAKMEKALEGIPYTFHTLPGKKIVTGIHEFARDQQADMLAIVPKEKGFIENLLGENHTKTLLFRSGIPILTLPPDDK